MDKKMKECVKAHPMLHSIVGIGVGFVLVALFPSLTTGAMFLGLLLIVVGVAGEFVWVK